MKTITSTEDSEIKWQIEMGSNKYKNREASKMRVDKSFASQGLLPTSKKWI